VSIGRARFVGSFISTQAEAIREFVENNEWQIHEIKAAIKEAHAGDFTTDEELAALAPSVR
jgi:predicted transcriptional regulator